MAQTTVTANPAVAQAGTFATAVDGAFQVISKLAAVACVPGKLVVVTVNAEHTCEPPDATGEVTGGRALGIALIDHRKTTMTSYAIGETVQIATEGEVWVAAEDAVTAGAPCFVRFADAGSTGLGSFRSDADTADAVALPNAIFTSSTTGAGLAKVRLLGVHY
jgi:hypothetical protein